MPRIVDHDESRSEFAKAAWATIIKLGFENTTIRAVAQAAGCSTGRLVHYFESKEELLIHAVRHARRQMTRRFERRREGKQGVAALRAVLLETLPSNARRRAEWRFWLAFWGQACSHPRLVREQNASHAGLLQEVRTCLNEAQQLNQVPRNLDLDRCATSLLAFIDGLGLIGTFNPRTIPARNQLEQLEFHLERLLGTPVVADESPRERAVAGAAR